MSATTSITRAERITNLDTVRGVATLGILVMNAVSFALPEAAYFNLDAAGSDTWLDMFIGVAGEIFIDQKTMALFSLLFGVGVVVFAERAEAKGRHATRLSLWRNVLLLVMGVAHSLVWDGDILSVYAICSVVLLMVYKRSPRALLVAGVALVLSSAVFAAIAQTQIDASGDGLGTYWFVDGGPIGDAAGLFLISDFFLRALGMMLVGVALFRFEIVQGQRPASYYRRMVRLGLGVGLPIAAAGVALQFSFDWGPEISLIGEAPNTLATIPVALGYLGLITLWNQREDTAVHHRVRAVGRMALTNYLAHTALGITLFRLILDRGDASRTAIAAFIVCVWAVQLWWSTQWLQRFRFGPLEWAWRCATYRSLQPLRRAGAPELRPS
jgi:uncharacterized protein